MPQFNHKAIWAMVLFQQALGFVWYSPPLFMNLWLKGLGKRPSDLYQSDPVPFIAAIVGAIAFCYILAWVNDKAKAESATDGAIVGGLVWLGFIAPTLAVHYKFIGLSWLAIGVDAGKELVGAVLTGAILAVWKK